MTDWIWGLPKFVMRHLETEAPTGIDFVHHKFFDFVNIDSDACIFLGRPVLFGEISRGESPLCSRPTGRAKEDPATYILCKNVPTP